MTKDLYSLFKETKEITPDNSELLMRIFNAIDAKRDKAIRTQKIIWRSTSFVFTLATFATGWSAARSLMSSDFGTYFSLIFSDMGSFTTIWRELSISIFESLPIIGIGLFLASLYLLFWSTRRYVVRSHTLAY